MIGLDRFKRQWLRFKLEETGTAMVEMMLMTPIMVWGFVITLQFFDAYRAELISTKAGLTIADMYSLETGYIDANYLNGTRSLLKFLTLAENNPDFRVTSFYWVEATKEYKTVWSRNRGSRTNLQDNDINAMFARLPKLSDGERAILLETWTDYQPKYGDGIGIMLGTGLEPLEFSSFVVISPRFAPAVCWNNDSATPPDPTQEKC